MTVTMGILRSHTTHNITSHFTSHPKQSLTPPVKDTKPSALSDPEPGISRSRTDPLNNKPTNSTNSSTSDSKLPRATSSSNPSSGASSPRRMTSSLEIVRNIRDNSASHIPKYHVFAEQVHRYKMRHCTAMDSTEEEKTKIKDMKKWNWKHSGHPGEAKPPVGPMGEMWEFDGCAAAQLGRK